MAYMERLGYEILQIPRLAGSFKSAAVAEPALPHVREVVVSYTRTGTLADVVRPAKNGSMPNIITQPGPTGRLEFSLRTWHQKLELTLIKGLNIV